MENQYSLGDLVQIPINQHALVNDPFTNNLIACSFGEYPTIGIIIDILESDGYGEITILSGNEFMYIPTISERPNLHVLEKLVC